MKFPRPMNNTERELLAIVRRHSATVPQLVSYLYPKSKQPQRKAVTFRKHLKMLAKRGLVAEVGGVWIGK